MIGGEYFLEKLPSLEKDYANKLLIKAAEMNNQGAIEDLIWGAGADVHVKVDYKDPHGYQIKESLIKNQIRNKKYDFAKFFIGFFDQPAKNNLLIEGVLSGDHRTVYFALLNGAQSNIKAPSGESLLLFALKRRDWASVNLLIAFSGDEKKIKDTGDEEGNKLLARFLKSREESRSFLDQIGAKSLEPPKISLQDERAKIFHETVEVDMREGLIMPIEGVSYKNITTQQISSCVVLIPLSDSHVGFAHIHRLSGEDVPEKSFSEDDLIKIQAFSDPHTKEGSCDPRSYYSFSTQMNGFLDDFEILSGSQPRKIILYSPSGSIGRPFSIACLKDIVDKWAETKYKTLKVEFYTSREVKTFKGLKFDIEGKSLSEIESAPGDKEGASGAIDPMQRYGVMVSSIGKRISKLSGGLQVYSIDAKSFQPVNIADDAQGLVEQRALGKQGVKN